MRRRRRRGWASHTHRGGDSGEILTEGDHGVGQMGILLEGMLYRVHTAGVKVDRSSVRARSR